MQQFDMTSFRWMADLSRHIPQGNLPITAGMETAWRIQSSPRYPLELQTGEQSDALYCWWLIDGLRHHPCIPFIFSRQCFDFLTSPHQLPSGRVLPVWLYGYWLSNWHLQKAFPLHHDDGLARLILWCFFSADCPPALMRGLSLPQETVYFLSSCDQHESIPLPAALRAAHFLRQDLRNRYSLESSEGRAALLIHWVLWGKYIAPLPDLALDISMADRLLSLDNNSTPLFTRALRLVFPDAVQNFPIDTEGERARFHHWAWEENFQDVRNSPLVRAVFAKLLPHLVAPCPNDGAVAWPDAEHDALPYDQHEAVLEYVHSCQNRSGPECLDALISGGVNIMGFASGELGIGEDARMAAEACRDSRIPFVVYEPPFAIASRREDITSREYISNKAHYAVNVVFLPGVETLRLFFHSGAQLFQRRFTIGAWQWELPNWPTELNKALPLVQEIWSPSRFIMHTMRTVAEVPVVYMPMAVELPDFAPRERACFALPDGCLLFLYIFDGLSWGTRKNPLAAIRAFQDAFAKSDDVRLVIKTMNASPEMPFWEQILHSARRDHRILPINEVYSKQTLLALFNCCDVYVSLHRAEGFGRTLAEAMLLAKPVIATAWSGNADFTTEETAFPIGGRLIPVHRDEYSFWKGQEWCEPSHDEAVAAMRTCFDSQSIAAQKAQAARAFIQRRYSSARVGSLYRDRLNALGVI